MRQHGIQIHSQIRAGGIAINPRPAAEDVVADVDCMQAYSSCRTNKIKAGMSPAIASQYCKTLLIQCQQTAA